MFDWSDDCLKLREAFCQTNGFTKCHFDNIISYAFINVCVRRAKKGISCGDALSFWDPLGSILALLGGAPGALSPALER